MIFQKLDRNISGLLGLIVTITCLTMFNPTLVQAQTVIMSISPATTQVENGDTFSVSVQVVAGSRQVDGAEAHLNFNPEFLRVNSLTKGETLPTTLIDGSYDNINGEIDYAAGVELGSTTPPPSGTFDLILIEFEALAATDGTALTFGFVFPRETIATFQGAPILSGVTNGTVVIVVNEAPVANDQSVEVDEDHTLDITLTAADNENDPLTYEVITQPQYGSLSGDAPDLAYTPGSNYNGIDSFTFKANDGKSDSNIATVSITVNPVNDAPVANAQAVSTDEDTPATITLTASDVDGDSLTYSVAAGPAHGVLSGSAPNLTYTPAANYNGADSFTFRANDGTVDSNLAAVSITVNPVNDTPVADNQTVSTDEDTPVAITLTASDVDGDSLTYSVAAGPAHGVLSGSAPNLTYTPDDNYYGADSFTFRANDGTVNSNLATVSIMVIEAPKAIILGSVDLQGRPETPNARWIIPLTVKLYAVGASMPTYELTPTTDENGAFTINAKIVPGTYEIAVKNFHTLQNVVTITLLDGNNPIDFGTLLEGDANGDNKVSLLDFSTLATAFNAIEGDAEFDPCADFNEDGVISLLDFSLLATNFNGVGQEVPGLPQP